MYTYLLCTSICHHAGKYRVIIVSVCNVGLMVKNEEIMKRAKSREDGFQVHCDSKSHCINVVDYTMWITTISHFNAVKRIIPLTIV